MSNSYRAPLEDMQFALFDVLGIDTTFEAIGRSEVNRELVEAILEEAGRFTETVLAPLNAIGDAQGCVLDVATHSAYYRSPAYTQALDELRTLGH